MANWVLKVQEVVARTRRSRSSIYASVKAGEFPAPVSLGPRAVGWRESDIDAWIDSRPQVGCAAVTKKHVGGT